MTWLRVLGRLLVLAAAAGAIGCIDTRREGDDTAASGGAGGSGVGLGGSGGSGAAAASCDAPMQTGNTCLRGASIPAGSYWISNNLWGEDSGAGEQCVWRSCLEGGTVGWGTSWNWTGVENSVKSYASVVLGWHWGWRVANTGLPLQISSNRTIDCSWNFEVTQSTPNTMNVAYDLWLHTIPNADYEDNPTDEIMIWVYRDGGAGPIGPTDRTVTLQGATWELHRGFTEWNVYSFVRGVNAPSTTLNIMEFLQELVELGWVDSAKYLSSIQAGTEIFTGSGQLDTSSYACELQ